MPIPVSLTRTLIHVELGSEDYWSLLLVGSNCKHPVPSLYSRVLPRLFRRYTQAGLNRETGDDRLIPPLSPVQRARRGASLVVRDLACLFVLGWQVLCFVRWGFLSFDLG